MDTSWSATSIDHESLCVVCGGRCKGRTSWTDLNPGRRYVIVVPTMTAWISPGLIPHVRKICSDNIFLRRINKAEAEIEDCKVKERKLWEGELEVSKAREKKLRVCLAVCVV